MTVPVCSKTQSRAWSTVGGTAPLVHTFCSWSTAANTFPSYQNDRFSASPAASPTRRSGRRIATRRRFVSCRLGLCSGTSSYTSSASRANAATRASRSLICLISSSARGSTRRDPGASSGSMSGAGGSSAAASGALPRQPEAVIENNPSAIKWRIMWPSKPEPGPEHGSLCQHVVPELLVGATER